MVYIESVMQNSAIIAALPLKRRHHLLRPVDADLVHTSTVQVALTILLGHSTWTKKQEFKTQLACNSHSIDVLNTDISIALQNEYISRHTVDSIMDKLKSVMV